MNPSFIYIYIYIYIYILQNTNGCGAYTNGTYKRFLTAGERESREPGLYDRLICIYVLYNVLVTNTYSL